MDSINSWINEDEVRQLAEDLTASPEEVKKWRRENFEGFPIPKKKVVVSKKTAEKVVKKSPEIDLDEEDLTEPEEETETELAQEVKDIKSSSLAGASAMAASAGLFALGKNRSDFKEINPKETPAVIEFKPFTKSVKESPTHTNPLESVADSLPPLCDHCLNEVPVNVENSIKVSLPSVNPDKELGTFEQIDQQLTKTVKANGICVIDRDGDVLYSSMKNQSLVAFTVDAMMGTKLMQTQDGEFGNIRIKVGAGEYLEFVSVKSTRGVLILAASMNQVLGNKNSQFIAADILKIANMA